MHRLFATLLLAALLLAPMALSAQTPVPPDAASFTYRTIILQHAVPSDILKTMHWGAGQGGTVNLSAPNAAIQPNLPKGVAQVFALQSNNALLLKANDDGYAQVKAIVKILDIAPPRVRLQITVAAVPAALNFAVDISDPNQALTQLHSANAKFYQPLPLKTDNNVPICFPILWHLHAPMAGSVISFPNVSIVPHINKGDLVALSVDFGKPPSLVTHMVSNKEMTVYDITGLPDSVGYRVFLFVTPTVVEPSVNNDNAITITP